MPDWWVIAWSVPGGLVLAAGVVYLVATRRRSRRATRLGLVAALGLFCFHVASSVFGPWLARVVLDGEVDLGVDPLAVVHTYSVLASAGHWSFVGLLIYAVAVDRPPTADGADD